MPIFCLSSEHLNALAREAGFDLAGIAAAPEPRQEERGYFERWVAAGRAGEMHYLERRNEEGELLRSRLHAAFPWARSVIVCAKSYAVQAPHSLDAAPKDVGWIARYAWSGKADRLSGELRPSDYHDVLLARLRRLESRLKEEIGAFESRAYVDTGPLIEREWAARAGIGWTGKNVCVLNQRLGSWLFLGVVVTELEVAPEALPFAAADRCGTCRRCLDACPTGALTGPREMDANLCISYLTIEKRGAIPEPLREQMGRQIFGCDICQEVCPWNREAAALPDEELAPRPELVNPALEWLAALDAQEFNRLFRGSPVKRAKRAGMRRNLAIAMGNSGLAKFLPRLTEWSRSDDPVLAETAAWAQRRIEEAVRAESRDEAAPETLVGE